MKGILFKPDMIKAIREGRKTQTRRIIGVGNPDFAEATGEDGVYVGFHYRFTDVQVKFKPRYQVGEVVYIKEAYAVRPDNGQTMTKREYEHIKSLFDVDLPELPIKFPPFPNIKFKSPLFMPEKYARYFIQITDVRAERLQEITEEEAIAEGVDIGSVAPPVMCYCVLWDSINKKHPWSSNPLVWVYTFQRKEYPVR